MDRIDSILVVVGDEANAPQELAKAVALARLFGARLELFRCNADVAYFQQHQYDTVAARGAQERCAAQSREHLTALWKSLGASELPVSIDATCESPEYDSIVRKVRRCKADLVVRGLHAVRTEVGEALDANDWNLVRACPVPLLLTRGRVWAAAPQVAAAVDISGDEIPELTRSILSTARRFSAFGRGNLEILYADGFESPTPEELQSHRAVLAKRAQEADVDASGLHILAGDPATIIPPFVTHRGYDLVVMGALTHRRSSTPLVGTLTGRLMETLESDLLFVKVLPPDQSSQALQVSLAAVAGQTE